MQTAMLGSLQALAWVMPFRVAGPKPERYVEVSNSKKRRLNGDDDDDDDEQILRRMGDA